MIKSIYLPQLWDMELHKLNSTYYIQSTVLCSAAEIEFLLPHQPILNDFSHFFQWTLPNRHLFLIKIKFFEDAKFCCWVSTSKRFSGLQYLGNVRNYLSHDTPSHLRIPGSSTTLLWVTEFLHSLYFVQSMQKFPH